jgi:hypothetical protein
MNDAALHVDAIDGLLVGLPIGREQRVAGKCPIAIVGTQAYATALDRVRLDLCRWIHVRLLCCD